jgi:outer membrane receptor protein involved in Fe transport
MRRFILLSLSFFLVLLGQNNITGTVIDGRSEQPLIGVAVIVVGTDLGTSTDMNGRFEIDDLEPGNYQLEFSYLGYETVFKTDLIVNTALPATVTTKMYLQLLEAEGVTVTAGYFSEELNATTSTINLDREEIRRFPGGFEDVVRTVTTLPGVTAINSGGRNDLLVRGGGPSENLYTINNIEVPNINHFGTQGNSSGTLSFVNLDAVESVDFSTGGFSVQYGDKLSSVLSLGLNPPAGSGIGGKALISATQFGLNLQGRIGEQGNYFVSARQSYLDLIFKAAGLAFIPVYTDYNLIVNYDLTARDKFFVLGLVADDRVERTLDTRENIFQNAGIMDNTQQQYITGVNYRRLLSQGYVDVTANYNDNHYFFAQADTSQVPFFNSDANERDFGLKGKFYWQFDEKLRFQSGLGSRRVINESKTTFAEYVYTNGGVRVPRDSIGLPPELLSNESFDKHFAFAEVDYNLTPAFDIRLGVRADYYAAIDEKYYLAPRLGLNYIVNDHFRLKGSVGRYFQAPSVVWLVNPNNRSLKALQNDMFIIGGDYLLSEDTRFVVEVYFKDYSQLPTGTIAGFNDHIVLSNIGNSFGGSSDNFQSFGYNDYVSSATGIAYGIEFSLQKKFSEVPFYYQSSLSIGKSEFVAGNGQTYPGNFDQRFIFNLNGGYRLANDWEFSGKFRLYSGIPYTPQYVPEENPVNPGFVENIPEEYLSERLAISHTLDVRVDRYFNFSGWRLTLFLDIQNIYNFDLPQIPRYRQFENEVDTQSSIGILPSIGVSAEF